MTVTPTVRPEEEIGLTGTELESVKLDVAHNDFHLVLPPSSPLSEAPQSVVQPSADNVSSQRPRPTVAANTRAKKNPQGSLFYIARRIGTTTVLPAAQKVSGGGRNVRRKAVGARLAQSPPGVEVIPLRVMRVRPYPLIPLVSYQTVYNPTGDKKIGKLVQEELNGE